MTMDTLNGIALDNPSMGWRRMRGTNPYAPLSAEVTTSISPGWDGDLSDESNRISAPIIPVEMLTPRANLEALTALFMAGGDLADSAGRKATVSFVDRSVQHWGSAEDRVFVTFLMRIPGVWWRGTETTPAATSLNLATVSATLFAGITGRIPDPIVRVKGAVSALQVTDAGGSWFTYPSLAAGEWLRFHPATNRAYITTTDTWTGGTEVSGRIDFGGPRQRFELTPVLTSALNPSTRAARLTITTTSRTSASLQVRARPSYSV